MKLSVEINCDNAIFRHPYDGSENAEYRNREMHRLLNRVIWETKCDETNGTLIDKNGNTVGFFRLEN